MQGSRKKWVVMEFGWSVPGEIAEALKKALASDRPAVVDVVTDVACKAPSPWTPPQNSRDLGHVLI